MAYINGKEILFSPVVTVVSEKVVQIIDGSITELTAKELNGCTAINNKFFQEYLKLESIAFPKSITKIGSYAFNKCSALKNITFARGSELTEIGAYAFGYLTSIESINFEENTKLIIMPTNLFSFSNLKSIIIPDSVETMEGAFNRCLELESVTFGENSKLTSIEKTFYYNDALKKIILPKGLTNIGNSSFLNCSVLEEIVILAETPPTLGASGIKNCTALKKIIVPIGCGAAYKSATNWATFADLIQEATE